MSLVLDSTIHNKQRIKAFVLKEDAGLELNIAKTSILPSKGVTAQAAFDMAHSIIAASPALTQLSGDISRDSFCPEGFIGIGVPIGTDAFVRSFVAKTCRDIIEDVEKLDACPIYSCAYAPIYIWSITFTRITSSVYQK